MSWDISLQDDSGNLAQVKLYQEGGTQRIGGTTDADLNVTYNYSRVTKLVGFHFSELNNKKAKDTINLLERVVYELEDSPYETDYWAPTPGNAGHAAAILLKWAKQYPEYTWHVS